MFYYYSFILFLITDNTFFYIGSEIHVNLHQWHNDVAQKVGPDATSVVWAPGIFFN